MGWNWAGSAYNERVEFQNGVNGVVGCEGWIEDAKNDVGKLFIDIGATSAEDAAKYVKLGDVCGYFGPWIDLQNDRVSSRSLDDRIGCYQLLEALKENDGTYPNDVYYVFTVQEEVGCRGSKVTAAQGFSRISVSLWISHRLTITPATCREATTVDGGIGIKICDPSVVCDPDLVAAMEECCERDGIKYQREVIDKGGTDASSMNLSNWGVKVSGIVTVVRYPHAQCSVASKKDIEAGVDLMKAISAYEFKD